MSGFDRARLARLGELVAGHVERDTTGGVAWLAARHDDVEVGTAGVLTRGEPQAVQRDTLFRIASITKPITAVAALILVFELLRRRRLREKYAAIWVVIALGTLIVAAFPQILRWVADLVGIQTPSNLLFFGSLIVLFAVSLQLSREVGLLEEQSRRLAEEVGTLTMRVDALEKPPDD